MSNPRNNYEGVILTLYNPQNEEVAISKVNNRYFYGWTYSCKYKGKFRLVATMEKGADEETVIALAKRKNEMRAQRKQEILAQDFKEKISQAFELNHKEYNYCSIYAYLEDNEQQSKSFKDYYLKVFKPNGEQIKMNGYDETKSQIIGFKVVESGLYRVEVVPTKGSFPADMKLSITKRYFEPKEEKQQIKEEETTKAKPTPFAGLKEYDIPANKESEFVMVLNKNITYEFKVIKGEAEIYIISKDEKKSFVSSDNILLVKNLSEAGIYNMRVKPKGDTDAKVTFAVVTE
jgi:hypothetical protein